MTSTSRTSYSKRIAATCAIVGLATVGIAAAPKPANAWWHGYGYGYGWGGAFVPPVVIAPAPVYAPPPVYYAPPSRAWIPAHWENGYWVPGHWS
jgi:hypothetical protein